jgi:CBS domain-containing protein
VHSAAILLPGTTLITPVNPELLLYFRGILRDARLRVLRDSEDYQHILRAIEQLGAALYGRVSALDAYRRSLLGLASRSALFEVAEKDATGRYTSPRRLFALLREARNDAMHLGAYARLVARHAVEFSLLLEDALVNGSEIIDDFIVRDPIVAELWQPVGIIRQVMLQNSFSCLPVRVGTGDWELVSDAAVARLLRGARNNGERKSRLTLTVAEAIEKHRLTLVTPVRVKPGTSLTDIFAGESLQFILVVGDNNRLLGMATPFDLL